MFLYSIFIVSLLFLFSQAVTRTLLSTDNHDPHALPSKGKSVVLHKNSLKYTGSTHVYEITNPKGTHKIGESAQGFNKYGQSKRGEMQARKLLRETGVPHKSKILAILPSKKEARKVETALIQAIRQRSGTNTLPGNKGLH